ncbi:TetR/AcrR family transcriptional regulator [Lachnospiraceae bacterium ZAX-1]
MSVFHIYDAVSKHDTLTIAIEGRKIMRVSKKHDVRLNEILDAAELLFNQKGYEQATVNDILEKVEIGKGTFYHYFKSKEDVMVAVISRMTEGLVKQASAIAEDESLGAHEKLKRILFAINIDGSPNEATLRELHQPNNAQMHQSSIAETVQRIAPIMAEVVKQGVSEGIYSTPYPLETMEFLLAANQLYLGLPIFRWTKEELVTRAMSCVRIIELSLGAAEGSFCFLLDSIENGNGTDYK